MSAQQLPVLLGDRAATRDDLRQALQLLAPTAAWMSVMR